MIRPKTGIPQISRLTDDVIGMHPESSHPSAESLIDDMSQLSLSKILMLKRDCRSKENIHASNMPSIEDSFDIHPDIESSSTPLTQNPTRNTRNKGNNRHNFERRDSLISQSMIGRDEKENSKFRLSKNTRFYIFFLVLPTIVSLLFSIAILFPCGARQRFPLLLWTDGTLEISEEGKWTLCPRDSVCSEGAVQILLIVTSRLTAFASYTVIGMVFLSKMHCSIHWMSSTLASTIIPLERLHNVHKKTGTIYILLILLHTVAHFVRWSIRQEIMKRINTQVGFSGLIGILSIIVVVLSMTSLGKKAITTFESRLNLHYLFLVLAGALFFHTARCRYITMVFL